MERPLVTESVMRELAVVLAVGVAGLLIAGVVAFAPWYENSGVARMEPPPVPTRTVEPRR